VLDATTKGRNVDGRKRDHVRSARNRVITIVLSIGHLPSLPAVSFDEGVVRNVLLQQEKTDIIHA